MRRGQELYRIPDEGKVAGVCAGIAEYFNMETWLVRIIVITGVLFSGAMFIICYIAAWFILDAHPGSEKYLRKERRRKTRSRTKDWKKEVKENLQEAEQQVRSHFERRPVEVKEKVWQEGEPPVQAFRYIT